MHIFYPFTFEADSKTAVEAGLISPIKDSKLADISNSLFLPEKLKIRIGGRKEDLT